ncbi:MAG: hypothetical protein V4615_04200 [Bacteroidota bacterium]
MSWKFMVRSSLSNTKRFVLTIALCLLSCILFISTTSFSFLNTFETKASIIAVDNFSNFYSASNNGILKFSPEGKFLNRYEEFRYGKIGMLDVSNPMKILVFYPDFMTVVITDKFLAPINTYNFFQLGYQNISAISSSTDGRIWFYDNIDFKLKKIDESGKTFLESQQLNVLLEKAPNPNFMIERDRKVYLNDTAIGIMVFDIFGSYSKTIPLKGLTKFQVLQDEIVFFKDNQLNSYNPLTLELKSLPLPDTTDVSLAVLEKNRLGILKKEKVDFYKY